MPPIARDIHSPGEDVLVWSLNQGAGEETDEISLQRDAETHMGNLELIRMEKLLI
jgi:hypothetical protein